MSGLRSLLALLAAAGVSLLGACQSGGSARAVPAVLADDDEETLVAVRTALAEALGRARIELGPGDPTAAPQISVLPRPPGPYETRSTARPTTFDILLKGGACYALRRDTGEEFPLKEVACRPL